MPPREEYFERARRARWAEEMARYHDRRLMTDLLEDKAGFNDLLAWAMPFKASPEKYTQDEARIAYLVLKIAKHLGRNDVLERPGYIVGTRPRTQSRTPADSDSTGVNRRAPRAPRHPPQRRAR